MPHKTAHKRLFKCYITEQICRREAGYTEILTGEMAIFLPAINTHTHTHTHIYIYIYTHTHTHTHTHLHAQIYKLDKYLITSNSLSTLDYGIVCKLYIACYRKYV